MVDVIFCIPGNNFSGNFLDSFTKLIEFCHKRGITYKLSRQYSSVVHFARSLTLGASNSRGKNQAPFGGKIDYKYLFFIDSDIVFTPDHFKKIMRHDVDIVSGYYIMEDNKRFAVVKEWDEEYFQANGYFEFMTPDQMGEEKSLFEVSYAGMGWMCVKKGVFENLEYPWFFPYLESIGSHYDMTSEDVAFCRRAQEKGYKILVDPECRVGHEKRKIL